MKPKAKAKRGAKPVKEPEKVNPFEVKVNRQKHAVLGRKSKSDRGLLGVSRNKAIKKRKETLLQEYVLRNKSSAFMDKRIGEFDSTMNSDDKMAARLAQERKISQKKSVFSLNEEEELTHLGKSITDMKTHDDPRSDDEDLYDKLGRDFADKANFGGFLTKADPSSDAAKSRKEAIEKLIAESKKLKHERQVEKDENFELTEKLDSDWKEFQGLLAASKNKKRPAEDKEASTDDYDMLVKQLRFAPLAGQASERVKTEDEVAREERKRLEKLEQERNLRARGTAAKSEVKRQFASADDLDDSFYKRERITGTTEASESDEDEMDQKEVESGPVTDADFKETECGKSGSEHSEEEEGEESDEDSYADLESEEEIDSDNEEPENEAIAMPHDSSMTGLPVKGAIEKNDERSEAVKSKEGVADKQKLTAVAVVPDTEEEFSELLQKKTADEKSALIERMINSNRTSAASRKKLEMLFVFLLQHISDTADEDIQLVDKLCPHIYALVQLSPLTCGHFLVDVISEKDEELQSLLNKKAKFSVSFPSFSTLVFLKLVGQCYSASDFSHVVATPAMLLASQMLTCCGLKDPVDFLRGTFVANVFLEYVSYSKRFSPELLTFLARLLCHDALKLEDENSAKAVNSTEFKLPLKVLGNNQLKWSDELKVRVVYAGVKLLQKCASLYEVLPSYPEIAASLSFVCHKLTSAAYPVKLKDLIGSTLAQLGRKVERKPLRPSKKPPAMKQLLEPKFSMKFDGRKHFTGGEKKVEMKKLNYQYKKEMKGAMREVRRDNQFLAHHILKERIEKDMERKEKVKRIYRDLANQEGEFKALKKKKEKLSNRM